MKTGYNHTFRQVLFFICLTMSQGNIFSQSKLPVLLGKWKVIKFEYSDTSDNNIASLERESFGSVVLFEKGGIFKTYKQKKDNLSLLFSGNFRLADNNKFLYQDDKKSEIINLTNVELLIKINDELIIRFTKMTINE